MISLACYDTNVAWLLGEKTGSFDTFLSNDKKLLVFVEEKINLERY